jgi:hypothetical protein
MQNQISRYPELQDCFNFEHADLMGDQGGAASNIDNNIIPQVRWSRSLRLMIINHLITFDINISLLIEVVETYRFTAEVEEL